MASTYDGTISHERWENLRRHREEDDGINVGRTERIVSGVVAAVVAAVAVRRRRLRPLLFPLAGNLIARAVSGRCAVNRALGRNSAQKGQASRVASVPRGEGIKVEKSVVVNRPAQELYRFWRNFENLPRFMDHLESVTVLDENRSHWVAKAPAGTKVEWDATIHNEIENQLIAWRSLPGADVDNAGSVHFTPSAGGAATEVRVVLSYDPPAGKLGAAVARLFGQEPSKQVEDDLRRFKQVMEAAEVTGNSRHPAGRI
ncbi:MAG TPA: SRPBCC family protein [Gemmatimonadales bacterium]|nr:SRPBCC family protein [Gemmatimonadales bacterium]